MTLADDFLHSFIQCIRWCLRFFLPHNLRHTVSSLIRAKGYFNRDDELKSVVAKGFDLKIYSDHILDSLQIRCIRYNLSSRNQSLKFTRDLHFLLGRCIGNIQSKAGVIRAKKKISKAIMSEMCFSEWMNFRQCFPATRMIHRCMRGKTSCQTDRMDFLSSPESVFLLLHR